MRALVGAGPPWQW